MLGNACISRSRIDVKCLRLLRVALVEKCYKIQRTDWKPVLHRVCAGKKGLNSALQPLVHGSSSCGGAAELAVACTEVSAKAPGARCCCYGSGRCCLPHTWPAVTLTPLQLAAAGSLNHCCVMHSEGMLFKNGKREQTPSKL